MVNLPVSGVYAYAQDLSTEILCMSYAFDDEEVVTWLPIHPFPTRIVEHIYAEGRIVAHNATFERLITNYVLCSDFKVPEPSMASWYCTATQARANCAPASLEDVGRFAGLGMRKDTRGIYLVRALCIPRPDGSFNNDIALLDELYAYCERDVATMREFYLNSRQLSAEEVADYHINERINDRGVKIDISLAKAAITYADQELKDVQDLVYELSEGAITSVRSTKMREWVRLRVGKHALKLMEKQVDDEVKISIDKSVRHNLLVLADENPDEVPPVVADIVQCADDLWASSIAKFQRMISLADEEDERVRGALVFNGGVATGRASSYGLQVHNFTRICAKYPELVRADMVDGVDLVPKHGARVTDVLKKMLRPAIIAEKGNVFVGADWSAIEARVTPWLTNDPLADDVLETFEQNKDIYIREASKIFKCAEANVTDEMRQLGKIAILSCGFAGGIGAFNAMGRAYKVNLPEPEAKRIVDAWRKANPWAVHFWSDIEEAYMRAMYNRGQVYSVGLIQYMFDGQHLWYALPSQRILCYPYARIENGELTYAKASWKPSATDDHWGRARLWRGLATENVTQATANDVLRSALRKLDKIGLKVVLHVHDEIIVECKEEDSLAVETALGKIMTTSPDWARGLPLHAKTFVSNRYGKE